VEKRSIVLAAFAPADRAASHAVLVALAILLRAARLFTVAAFAVPLVHRGDGSYRSYDGWH